MAFEYTTKSEPSTLPATWDVETVAPNAERAMTTEESLASDPLTVIPCESAIRASPLIPAPPIPMK